MGLLDCFNITMKSGRLKRGSFSSSCFCLFENTQTIEIFYTTSLLYTFLTSLYAIILCHLKEKIFIPLLCLKKLYTYRGRIEKVDLEKISRGI